MTWHDGRARIHQNLGNVISVNCRQNWHERETKSGTEIQISIQIDNKNLNPVAPASTETAVENTSQKGEPQIAKPKQEKADEHSPAKKL